MTPPLNRAETTRIRAATLAPSTTRSGALNQKGDLWITNY
jgi:hypothetical protein